jgi:Ca2+-binding EF-hand superfamily protein
MNKPRPPKKTETLEVRVPHAVKRDVMARARSRGRTASAVLREFIDGYLAGDSPSEDRPMFKRLAKPATATAVVGAVIAAHVMLPTAAAAAPDFRSVFAQLDKNKDGKLTPDELADHGVLSDKAYVEHSADLGHGAVPMMVAIHSGLHQLVHGTASAAEMHANMRKTFASLDGDGNGTVTFGEFESHHLAVLRHTFDSIDADQDGTIERTELDTAMKRLPAGAAAVHAVSFEQFDANHDGGISWEEFLG